MIAENSRYTQEEKTNQSEKGLIFFPEGFKSSISFIKWGFIIAFILSIFLDLAIWSAIVGFSFVYFGNELRKFQNESFPEYRDRSFYLIILYGFSNIFFSIINTLMLYDLQENADAIADGGVSSIKAAFIPVYNFIVLGQVINIILSLGLAYSLYRFISLIHQYLSEHTLYDELQGKMVLFYLAPLGQIILDVFGIFSGMRVIQIFTGLQSIVDIPHALQEMEQVEGILFFVGFLALGVLIMFIYSAHILQQFFSYNTLPRRDSMSIRYNQQSSSSNSIYCETCGKEQSSTASFCIDCGRKMVEKKQYRCTKCGETLETIPSQCPICGSWVSLES